MSQSFGVISHTENSDHLKSRIWKRNRSQGAGFEGNCGFYLFVCRDGFISPARRTAWLTGSALSDDSQFFATATCICPNLPEVCPANHY
jgi:hypothetical protein